MSGESCCPWRRKITLFLGPILPEEACGVSDSVLADVMRFDLDGPPRTDGQAGTKGVIGFRFCPWCGKRFTSASEVRLSIVEGHQPTDDTDDTGEDWKKGGEGDDVE